MALTLNTNIASLTAQDNLKKSQSALQSSIAKLSSGFRVNSSADDAAGLSIATKMDSQIKGMTVASRNANDAISLTQTASSALTSVTSNFQRMRELAVQASNATNGSSDKDSLNTEFQQLANEVQRTLAGTQFNGINVLGSGAGALDFQIGAGTTANDKITLTTTNMTTDTAITDVTTSATNVIDNTSTTASLKAVIDNLDTAIQTVSTQQATFGAVQNRFQSVITNLSASITDQSAAKSRIMDVDFAAETATMTKNNILQQAGTSILAQANSLPNSILTLLR